MSNEMRRLLRLVESHETFPPLLNDAHEIAEYIVRMSPDDVDVDMVAEYFHGCRAVLRMVPISELIEGNADHNIRNKAREKRYAKMDMSTMPPLVVEDGTVRDGNHRFRIAVAKGVAEVPCYVIEYDEE